MDGSERRRHERVSVRFPCELAFGSDRANGTVRDLSAGGLSIQSDKPVDEGESVRVWLHPKGRPCVDIEALVWNVRNARDRRTGKVASRLGLVLSAAPDAFLDLLKAATPPNAARTASPDEPSRPGSSRERAQARAAKASIRAASTSESKPLPQVLRYSVHVKQSEKARTRTILVFAASEEDAKEKALAETEPGWSVLRVARSATPRRP